MKNAKMILSHIVGGGSSPRAGYPLLAWAWIAAIAVGTGGITAAASHRVEGGAVMSVRILRQPSGPPVPSMFMGYSIEWGLISRMLDKKGGRFDVMAKSIKALEKFTSPMLLRIGGDSEREAAFELPKLRHRPKFVGINITPHTLRQLGKLARVTGCQYVIGLNLAVDEPKLAVRLVKAADRYVGRRHIAAFEIGNESDLLGGEGHRTWWVHNNYNMYLRRWTRYYHAIKPWLGKAKIEGPAFSGEHWFNHLPNYFRLEHKRLGIVSLHNYPMGVSVKNPRSPQYASIRNLLSPRSTDIFAHEMRQIRLLAAPYHLPVRFGEMNSVSGGGKRGVSNTFASTLWTVSTLLGIAQAGGAGVNLHMSQGIDGFPGWYAPLRFGPGGHLHVMPEYIGMLVAADVIQHDSRPVDLRVRSRLNASIFAFESPHHTFRVAVINRMPTANLTVRLRLPAGMRPVRRYLIDAPNVRASKGVTITGFRVSGAAVGRLNHTELKPEPASLMDHQIVSPAGSVVIAVYR